MPDPAFGNAWQTPATQLLHGLFVVGDSLFIQERASSMIVRKRLVVKGVLLVRLVSGQATFSPVFEGVHGKYILTVIHRRGRGGGSDCACMW